MCVWYLPSLYWYTARGMKSAVKAMTTPFEMTPITLITANTSDACEENKVIEYCDDAGLARGAMTSSNPTNQIHCMSTHKPYLPTLQCLMLGQKEGGCNRVAFNSMRIID